MNPAKAGPFDLGKVIVRAKIDVDPETAALTITTDTEGPYKIPTIIDGIPLQIKHVNVDINRPGFTFNPTNCSPLAITGTLGSAEGSLRGAVGALPGRPTARCSRSSRSSTASTSGKTSRANGASLTVKLGYPAGPYDANIARVKVELPKQLPSRLTTLQKACTGRGLRSEPRQLPGGVDHRARDRDDTGAAGAADGPGVLRLPRRRSVPEPDHRAAGLRRDRAPGRLDVHQQSRDHEQHVQDRARRPRRHASN